MTEDLKLPKWAKEYGVRKLAKKLNYHEATIHKWMKGDGPPDARTIYNLIKLSKGSLDFKDIYIESSRRLKHEHV